MCLLQWQHTNRCLGADLTTLTNSAHLSETGTICVYCGKEKRDHELSLEHIWPTALGGDFLPFEFRTRHVCRTCNSLAGRFVDAAFLKSWFGQAERTLAAYEYLDLSLSSNSIVPLQFLTPIAPLLPLSGMTIELYVGPCQTRVFHVRPQDDGEAWDTYAGGDPAARRKDPGRIYIVLNTTNGQWAALALRSVKAQFSHAERYIVNAKLPPVWHQFATAYDENDPTQAADIRAIRIDPDGPQPQERQKFTISIDLDHRFLAKVALGLGYTLLGPEFLRTGHALNLRTAMRQPNSERRAEIPLRGTSYLGQGADLKPMAFPGAWVLYMVVIANHLVLSIVTPRGKTMTIGISDSPHLWAHSDSQLFSLGYFYIVVPALGTAVGPLTTPEYLNHKLKNRPNPILSGIEAKRVNRPSLPPCR